MAAFERLAAPTAATNASPTILQLQFRMISVEYCQLLARYNHWMNERLYAVVSEFSADERDRDTGAFFGSMHRTLNHILWGDRVWLARFTGQAYSVPAYGADMVADFAELARERAATDTAILDWAGQLPAVWLAGTLEYRSASDGRLRHWRTGSRPRTCSSTRPIIAGRSRRWSSRREGTRV